MSKRRKEKKREEKKRKEEEGKREIKRKEKIGRGKRFKDECRKIDREQRTDIARNREREKGEVVRYKVMTG